MIDIGGDNNKSGDIGNNNHPVIILTLNNGNDNKNSQIALALQIKHLLSVPSQRLPITIAKK